LVDDQPANEMITIEISDQQRLTVSSQVTDYQETARTAKDDIPETNEDLNGHPKQCTRTRMVRTDGHNHLPNFIGKFFPRADDDDVADFYCAQTMIHGKLHWQHFLTANHKQLEI